MPQLEKELDKVANKYLDSIVDKVYEIVLKAIVRAVYQFYTPTTYKRTYQLLENLAYKIDNGILWVYIDTESMDYYSEKDGRSVTEAVPYWVNEGHQARNYTPPIGQENNQFHRYLPPRHYLELAQELIKRELGIDAIIIKGVPPRL